MHPTCIWSLLSKLPPLRGWTHLHLSLILLISLVQTAEKLCTMGLINTAESNIRFIPFKAKPTANKGKIGLNPIDITQNLIVFGVNIQFDNKGHWSMTITYSSDTVDDWGFILAELIFSLLWNKSPDLVDVDGWAELTGSVYVEVSHTDLTEVSRMAVKQNKNGNIPNAVQIPWINEIQGYFIEWINK